MSTFVPSSYQQRLFDAVASGRGNYIVDAVAGPIRGDEDMPITKRQIRLERNAKVRAENKARLERLAEAPARKPRVNQIMLGRR